MVGDAAAPGEAAPAEADSGPVLALLSRGLEFWVRQQCQAIESLEIRLEGSALQLLRGRLAGVRVQARGVRYQDLEMAEVRLRSEAMRVRMGALVRRQVLELENPFLVVGSVVFSGEGLNRSLAHPNWSWLGDDLAEGLLGIRPLARLRLEEDRLVLQALPSGPNTTPVERVTQVEALEGTVALRNECGELAMRLPMDPGIQIKQANLGSGLLELVGEANVSP
jgi:hypothetical protein